MQVIEELYAFISSDETGEGVCGFHTGDGWLAMVAANPARVESLRPMAQKIANLTGAEIKLCKFLIRKEIDTFSPKRD